MAEEFWDHALSLIKSHAPSFCQREHLEFKEPESYQRFQLTPGSDTYKADQYWIKVSQGIPKTAKWSPLQREFWILSEIYSLNKKTIEQNLMIPIPKPIAIRPMDDDFFKPVEVLLGIEGVPLLKLFRDDPSLSQIDLHKIAKSMGRYMARLHAAKVESTGIFTMKKKGVFQGPWAVYASQMASIQFKKIRDADVFPKADVDRWIEYFDENKKLFLGEPTCITHNEVHPANIWVNPETSEVTGWLNWEKAGAAATLIDLALWRCNFPDKSAAKALNETYSEQRSMPPKSDQKLPMYALMHASNAALYYHLKRDEVNTNYFKKTSYEVASKIMPRFRGKADKLADHKYPKF